MLIAAINKAKNGIKMVRIPPYTSNHLKPLDVAVYGPFKAYYIQVADDWMTSNSAHEHQLSSHRLFTVTMFNQEVSALKEIICRFLLHLLRYIFFSRNGRRFCQDSHQRGVERPQKGECGQSL